MYILLKLINAIVNTLELYSSLIFYIYIYWNWNWMILEGKQNITKISKIFHFTHWTLRKKLKLSKKSKMLVLWKRSLSTVTYMKFKDKYMICILEGITPITSIFRYHGPIFHQVLGVAKRTLEYQKWNPCCLCQPFVTQSVKR